ERRGGESIAADRRVIHRSQEWRCQKIEGRCRGGTRNGRGLSKADEGGDVLIREYVDSIGFGLDLAQCGSGGPRAFRLKPDDRRRHWNLLFVFRHWLACSNCSNS